MNKPLLQAFGYTLLCVIGGFSIALLMLALQNLGMEWS